MLERHNTVLFGNTNLIPAVCHGTPKQLVNMQLKEAPIAYSLQLAVQCTFLWRIHAIGMFQGSFKICWTMVGSLQNSEHGIHFEKSRIVLNQSTRLTHWWYTEASIEGDTEKDGKWIGTEEQEKEKQNHKESHHEIKHWTEKVLPSNSLNSATTSFLPFHPRALKTSRYARI